MNPLTLPEFSSSFENEQQQEKKVMVVTVDGGPDENPWYTNTIKCAIEYFVEHTFPRYKHTGTQRLQPCWKEGGKAE